MSLLAQLVWTFGLISLLSIGGANATLPEIHRQVVELHHWMNDATFATLVAIGQIAPGPNVLIVSMIGWHLAGLAGMLATSAAMVLPSSVIAIGAGRFMNREEASETADIARRSLTPIAIGFMLASGVVMCRAAYVGQLTLIIVGVVTAVITFTRVSPVWSMAAGAIIGVAGHRLHLFG